MLWDGLGMVDCLSDEEGSFVGESDWTMSCTRERGCWPRFSRGGSNDDNADSSAREGVARPHSAHVHSP